MAFERLSEGTFLLDCLLLLHVAEILMEEGLDLVLLGNEELFG
jgi:hypothetical protein